MSQITCKAALLKNREASSLFMIEKVLVSAPVNEGEVRVKILYTGICNSDMKFIRNPCKEIPHCDNKKDSILLGQEASGIVESIGPKVKYVKTGDHVVVLRIPQCDECYLCKSNPKTNICEYKKGIKPKGASRIRVAPNGVRIMCGRGIGSFCEYITVPVEYLAKIDPEFPLDLAAVIGTVYLSGYGAAVYKAQVHAGSICAVYGLGALGLATIAGCKAAGAQFIIALDVNEEKFAFAKALGGTHFFNPLKTAMKNKRFDILFNAISAPGFDYVFECSNQKAALESGTDNLAPWGSLVSVCYEPQKDCYETVVSSKRYVQQGQTFTGGNYGGQKTRDGVIKVIGDIKSKKLNLEQFITRRIKLDEINKGFEWFKSGKKILTLIEM